MQAFRLNFLNKFPQFTDVFLCVEKDVNGIMASIYGEPVLIEDTHGVYAVLFVNSPIKQVDKGYANYSASLYTFVFNGNASGITNAMIGFLSHVCDYELDAIEYDRYKIIQDFTLEIPELPRELVMQRFDFSGGFVNFSDTCDDLICKC